MSKHHRDEPDRLSAALDFYDSWRFIAIFFCLYALGTFALGFGIGRFFATSSAPQEIHVIARVDHDPAEPARCGDPPASSFFDHLNFAPVLDLLVELPGPAVTVVERADAPNACIPDGHRCAPRRDHGFDRRRPPRRARRWFRGRRRR